MVLLVDGDGVGHAEAATVLGVKEGTIASRPNRAHQALHARLMAPNRERGATVSRDDLRLGDLLDALPVTEHQPDFWDRLEAELETETVIDLTGRRRRCWTLTAAAAAAIIAVVAIAYTLLDDPDTTDVTTDNPPTTVVRYR